MKFIVAVKRLGCDRFVPIDRKLNAVKFKDDSALFNESSLTKIKNYFSSIGAEMKAIEYKGDKDVRSTI